jgi:hypothetical protein
LHDLVDDSRKYVLLEHQEHTYSDKFALVEYMTHAAWRSLADAYEMLGLDLVTLVQEVQQQQQNQKPQNSTDAESKKTNIVLYFEGAVQCNFVEERQAEVIGNGHETIKTTSYGGQVTNKEERTIHRYTEYVWNVTQSYYLYACLSRTDENVIDGDSSPSTISCKENDIVDIDGNKITRRVDIARRSMSTNVISQVKGIAPVGTVTPIMVRIRLPAWWIQQMTSTLSNNSSFVIRRELKSCKTPRRNEDVQKVLDFHERLYKWHSRIIHFLHHQLFIKPNEKRPSSWNNMDEQWPAALFHHPILPIVLSENSATTEPAGILLPASHMNRILAEQKQLLQQKVDALKQDFPHPKDKPDAAMLSIAEATLHLRLQHLNSLLVFHGQGVGHVEEMLRRQLVQAVGKQLQAQDFRDYMEFHNSHRLFRKEYAPKPFSWAIRARPDQYPVGIVSIESKISNEQQPISTLTRHIPATTNNNSTRPAPIYIPINAATSVQLTGDRYLSGWIRYQFASGGGGAGQGDSSDSDLFHLAARARQFSSFMILIGTMTGPDTFDPKHAMILQNKDEVLIDLVTDVLPSAKQFKDAIASLSPEQQEFARAYRDMQLESSVFAIAIVQLKPQLEILLGLPSGALDIALTENLMKLFVEFQIPSDLLSYRNDDDDSATAGNVTTFDKVKMVKGYVKSVMDVIEILKKQELEEEKQKSEAREFMWDESTIQPLAASTSSRRLASATTAGATASGASDWQSSATTHLRALRNESPQTLDHASDKNARRSLDSMDESSTSQSSPAQQQHDGSPSSGEDFTLLPLLLDAKLEKYDTEGYLRSTVIKAWSSSWTLRRQKNLLSAPTAETLNKDGVAIEKKKAFDLLDAISQSGALKIASSQLHVIIGVTHCFTDSLIATVIEDDINPIAKAEKSTLMLASTIHGDMTPTDKMIVDGAALLDRLSSSFPELFTLPSEQQHGAGETSDQSFHAES